MWLRLLDVLDQLFVLAFIIWMLTGFPKRVKIVVNCIKEHNVRDTIGNSLFLLVILALWAYISWVLFDFQRFWGILVQ